MTDLRERFRATDRLRVDDVWTEARARAGETDDHTAVRSVPPHGEPGTTWRRALTMAAALLIGAASLAFLLSGGRGVTSPGGDANGVWDPAAVRGWIAYSSDGNIIVADPTKTDRSMDRRLLFQPGTGAAWPLSWSPDGSSLLFLWSRHGDMSSPPADADLSILHDDGRVTQVTTNGEPAVGSFAPDGTVVYTTLVTDSGVVRFDPATSDRSTLIEPGAGYVSFPAVSPNGRSIAFIRQERDGTTSIQIADANGSHERTLITDGLPRSKDASGLAWSPDGSQIVFGLLPYDNYASVYVVGAEGSGLQIVADGAYPSWSPDGTRLSLDDQG